MKILMINKFLYPNGGSETYVFKLGEFLAEHGHEVQYFGMEHEGRCVGNKVNAYTSEMDFHNGSTFSKITYPVKTIYSFEARKKIRLVLDDFMPDVCHINNFNYQLTPSIILEINRWQSENRKKCRIIYTAHDFQLVCPDNMLYNPNTRENCEKCLGGSFLNCIKGRCIHGSTAKSTVGTMEAMFWNRKGVYKFIDSIICCSEFLKTKLDSNPVLADKTVAYHNFVNRIQYNGAQKKDYVLYFGRFSDDKGIGTLIEAAKELPYIKFVFAGKGPLEDNIPVSDHIINVGFLSGNALIKTISEARFSICPSVGCENCPFSILESEMLGTPVIGSALGGIPELIESGKTGLLFEAGNKDSLKKQIELLWNNRELNNQYSENCKNKHYDSIDDYYVKLLKLYSE